MTAAAHSFTVYKLDHAGREVWRYPARVLERTGHCIRLEAFFNRDDMNLGYAVFRRGDRFIEYFYNDRWYNIFAIYDQENEELKGWYCNICRPAEINEAAVRCEDLALDMWISVSGELLILDEAEFARLPITPHERERCTAAVREIQSLAAGLRLPR